MLFLNTFKKRRNGMFIVYSYFIYLAVSLTVTVWVARTLHQRGRVFLVDAFHGQETLADSVNHLLVVGFYLINVGYVAFALKSSENPVSLRQAIELVSDKLGLVLLVLGLMHFFNLFVFSRIRKRAQDSSAPPPFPPDALLTPVEHPREG
jgi:TRAP-type C4-dicarboxylate transport system permease large subunit